MMFFAGILLLMLAAISYSFFKQLLAPAVLFPILWSFVSILHPICQISILPELYDIRIQTLIIILSGNIIFVVGSLAYYKYELLNDHYQKLNTLKESNIEKKKLEIYPINLTIRIALIILTILLIPVYIKLSILVVIQSGAEEVLKGLRDELTVEQIDIGPIKYLQPFSIVTYGFCEVEALKNPISKNKVLAKISFFAAAVCALFSTGRTFFLILLLLFLGLRAILKVDFKMISKLWLLPFTIVAFGLYGLVYNKGGSTDQPIQESLLGVSELTAIYIVTPITAYDLITSPPFEPSYDGYRVFRFFYLISNKLGLTDVSKDNLTVFKEFVSVPYEGNVFTIFGPITRDYGSIFALIFLFLVGWLHTYLYKKAILTKKATFSIYYSLLIYPLVMSFFDEQYLQALSLWIQLIIMIETIALVNSILYYKNKNKELA